MTVFEFEVMNNAPLISVIVPIHNVAPYISRCVKSIVDQSIGDKIEVILVENGSSDDSLAVCQQMALEYDNVRVVVSEKTGPSEARNFGLGYAAGMYVGFVDGDDYVASEMFESLVGAIVSTGATTSYCDFEMVYNDGVHKTDSASTGDVDVYNGAYESYKIMMSQATSSPCVRLFKTSFFADRGFPEGQFYEDHAIIYKWISQCAMVAHVNAPYYYYCLRQGSTTQSGCKIEHKMDLLRAELGRFKFAQNFAQFSSKQRKKLLKRTIKDAIYVLKSYVYYHGGAQEEYENVMRLRCCLLDGAHPSISQVGIGIWLRLFRIRFFWGSYYRHLVRKSS